MTEDQNQASRPILLSVGGNDCIPQPATFRLCPLGAQFYTDRPLREFDLMTMTIQTPGSAEPVEHTGAIIRCEDSGTREGRYRIWIKFLDNPLQTCDQIACDAHDDHTRCCFCEQEPSPELPPG